MARDEDVTPEEFQALLAVATPVEGSGKPVVRRPSNAGVGYAPVPARILRATFKSSSLAKSVVDVRTMRRTDVRIS